jgi:hypothetical protein
LHPVWHSASVTNTPKDDNGTDDPKNWQFDRPDVSFGFVARFGVQSKNAVGSAIGKCFDALAAITGKKFVISARFGMSALSRMRGMGFLYGIVR